MKTGGAEGIRTPDPHNAIVVLYQLSYDPSQSPDTLNTRPPLSKQNAAPGSGGELRRFWLGTPRFKLYNARHE